MERSRTPAPATVDALKGKRYRLRAVRLVVEVDVLDDKGRVARAVASDVMTLLEAEIPNELLAYLEGKGFAPNKQKEAGHGRMDAKRAEADADRSD